MAVYLISGDEILIGLELSSLVDRLVGDADRSMMVDDFDCSEGSFTSAPVVDALTTMSLFLEKKVVVLRHLQDLEGVFADTLVAAIDAVIVFEETLLVLLNPNLAAVALKF